MINVFVLCGKLRSTIGWLYNLWLGCILISIRNRSRNIYKSIIMISDYCNRFQHNRSPSWAPQCQRWRWRWRRQIKQSPMQFAYAHKHTHPSERKRGANIYATLAGKFSVIIIWYLPFPICRKNVKVFIFRCL